MAIVKRVKNVVTIPVVELRFDGQTIWVDGPKGTVLRVKVWKGIQTTRCSNNPSSHLDLNVLDAGAVFCLASDAGQ